MDKETTYRIEKLESELRYTKRINQGFRLEIDTIKKYLEKDLPLNITIDWDSFDSNNKGVDNDIVGNDTYSRIKKVYLNKKELL